MTKTQMFWKPNSRDNIYLSHKPSPIRNLRRYTTTLVSTSVYIFGKSSSAAGLTATVAKEPETGEFCIELYYLRFTKIDQGSEEIKTHPLLYWTTERLKDRELQEIAKGRFGNAKEDLDVLLETGLNKCPGSKAITQLIRTRNVLFNEGAPNIPTDITPGIQHTPNNHQQPEPNEGAPNIPTDITP
ncbi:hypothetical protein LXL04_004542 [Taraxacum kok-saghyz]